MSSGHVPSQLTLVVCLPFIPESSRPPGALEIHLLAWGRQPQCWQCSAPLDSCLCAAPPRKACPTLARRPEDPGFHLNPDTSFLLPWSPPRDWDLTPNDPPQVEPSGAEGHPVQDSSVSGPMGRRAENQQTPPLGLRVWLREQRGDHPSSTDSSLRLRNRCNVPY